MTRECCPCEFDAKVELDLDCVFEGDELAELLVSLLAIPSRCDVVLGMQAHP